MIFLSRRRVEFLHWLQFNSVDAQPGQMKFRLSTHFRRPVKPERSSAGVSTVQAP